MNDTSETNLYDVYNLDLITLKGGLAKTELLTRIKNIIKKDLVKVFDLPNTPQGQTPAIQKIKNDMVDLVQYILREVNALILGLKADKVILNDDILNLTLEVLQSIMQLSPQEIDLVKASVNFIINNNLIRKIATHKRLKKLFYSLLKKVV